MAGHVRKTSQGRYMARFPLGGRGRFRSKTFDRKIDAERWLTAQTSARDSGSWVDPRRSSETFGSVADAWLKSRRDVAASTLARDDSYLRNLILPHLGQLQLREVTVEELDGWVQHLDEVADKAPATVRKAFQIASSVLDRAVTLRKIPANPARVGEGISLPAFDTSEMRFLEPAEVSALAGAVPDRYRALILSAAYTGLRWGELAGLKAKRLSLAERRLTVAESLAEVGGHLSFKAPKTAASQRTVALPASLVAVLRDHLVEWPAVGDGLVFTDPEGGPVRRTNFRRRVWLPAVAETVGEPMRFHDLRHTHAAWLIAHGEHAKTIQGRLGHASIATTLDRYGHLMDGLDEAAADRLDSMLTAIPNKSASVTRVHGET
jgi:integrase